jgi:uncharacterized RDD family membrane protein YckC
MRGVVNSLSAAGLLRRLAAIFYDALLVAALLMLATAALLPLTHGEAIAADSPFWARHAYRAFLIAVVVVYFGYSWTRGGQTLGMLAWHIRVIRSDGSSLRWRDVGVRLLTALLSGAALGLGYLWMLVDRERLTWHDRLSRTRVVRDPSGRK